jgi:pimeloyl-ACP methyl ester carboxylesterase
MNQRNRRHTGTATHRGLTRGATRLGLSLVGVLAWASEGEAQNVTRPLACASSDLWRYQQAATNSALGAGDRQRATINSIDQQGSDCVINATLPAAAGKTPLSTKNVIAFQLRVPLNWNRKFFFQGGAGLDGYLPSAKGNKLGASGNAGEDGYAVISTNGGHFAFEHCSRAMESVDEFINCIGEDLVDDPFAAYSEFGLDPEARLDYGYRSLELVTKVGKRLVKEIYNKTDIAKSYFVGCSNGGRQAMMVAKRFPQEFDGVLAGAPAINLTKMAFQVPLETREASYFNDYPGAAFTDQQMRHVRDKVLEACDALDGAVDQMVGDPLRCQSVFNPSSLSQSSPSLWGGLPADKIAALTRMLAGAQVNGSPVYASWLWDPGLASNMITAASWRTWRLESVLGALDGWRPYPIMTIIGGGAIPTVLSSPPEVGPSTPRTPIAMWDYLKTVDTASHYYNTLYGSSGAFTPTHDIYDVPTPEALDGFAADGKRKLIVFSGSSDGAVATNDLIRWYNTLKASDAGKNRVTDDYARFYVVPGMGHCGAGRGTDQFNLFSVLEGWVEGKTAPAAAKSSWDTAWRNKGWGYTVTTPVATVWANNLDAPSEWRNTRRRPLCPFPMVAKYGWWNGPVDWSSSFVCTLPAQ